jgi:hypothetical protein
VNRSGVHRGIGCRAYEKLGDQIVADQTWRPEAAELNRPAGFTRRRVYTELCDRRIAPKAHGIRRDINEHALLNARC